jgi:hypothetical protein
MTTPAAPASFFSRLQTFERSKSYDGIKQLDTTISSEDGSGNGYGTAGSSRHASGTSTPTSVPGVPHPMPDMRRAVSLRVGGTNCSGGVAGNPLNMSMSSFGAAASTLSPEPLASRHPLFSHHRIPSSTATSVSGQSTGSAPTRTAASFGIGGIAGPSRPVGLPGMGIGVDVSSVGTSEAGPASPSPSSVSSTAFSPASAFLSHFSSVRSPSGSVLGVGSSTGPGTGAYVLLNPVFVVLRLWAPCWKWRYAEHHMTVMSLAEGYKPSRRQW